MAFDDVQFPTKISYGSSFTPAYRTDVIVLENKNEQRVSLDEFPTYVYDVAFGVKSQADMFEVHTFLHGRKGMARSFRFKDWLDFTANQTPLVVLGNETIQLTKRYISGPSTLNREIHKPIAPITMRRNASNFTDFTLDANTGIITLTPDSTSSIASSGNIALDDITNADPGVATTSAAHGLTTGEQVRMASVGGMTEINAIDLNITVLSPTTFEVGIDTLGFGTYTSGGNAVEVGVSRQNPAMIRSIAHGFTSTDVLFVKSVGGMTELVDAAHIATVLDVDHFTIPIDSTLFSLYTSGGTVQFHVQPSEDLDWSGEFDVRVRFGTDLLPATIEAFDIGNVSPIPLIGVRND